MPEDFSFFDSNRSSIEATSKIISRIVFAHGYNINATASVPERTTRNSLKLLSLTPGDATRTLRTFPKRCEQQYRIRVFLKLCNWPLKQMPRKLERKRGMIPVRSRENVQPKYSYCVCVWQTNIEVCEHEINAYEIREPVPSCVLSVKITKYCRKKKYLKKKKPLRFTNEQHVFE